MCLSLTFALFMEPAIICQNVNVVYSDHCIIICIKIYIVYKIITPVLLLTTVPEALLLLITLNFVTKSVSPSTAAVELCKPWELG